MILPLRVWGRCCVELDLARGDGGAEALAAEADQLEAQLVGRLDARSRG